MEAYSGPGVLDGLANYSMEGVTALGGMPTYGVEGAMHTGVHDVPGVADMAGGMQPHHEGEFQQYATFVNTYAEHRTWGVSTMAYDTMQDLLWVGSGEVRDCPSSCTWRWQRGRGSGGRSPVSFSNHTLPMAAAFDCSAFRCLLTFSLAALQGVMTSYFGEMSEKYSSYQAHRGPVNQIAFTQNTVASVGGQTLELRSRGGVCHYEVKSVSTCLRPIAVPALSWNQLCLWTFAHVIALLRVFVRSGQA